MNKQLPTAACDQIAADFRGRIGFYIEDLTTGITHEYNADQRFPTASVCKVPVMIELFHQAETGNLSLDDRHRLHGDISTHGSGMLKLMEDEPELTLRDYCRLMISISDNMATDFLLGGGWVGIRQRHVGRDGLPQHPNQCNPRSLSLSDVRYGGRPVQPRKRCVAA